MIKSFRLQLTLWYLGLFSLLFLLFSVFLYNLQFRGLLARLDDTLSSEARTAVSLFRDELAELKGDIPGAAVEAVSEMGLRDVWLAVFEGSRLLGASGPASGGQAAELAAKAASGAHDEILATLPRYGPHGARALAHRFSHGGHSYILLAISPLDTIEEDLAVVRRVLYICLPLLLLIAGLGGFWLAARSLAPLQWMAEQARNISHKNLDKRLEIGAAHEELTLLADSFNALLSRLDGAFETMRRFVADASHELRTPLAIIRGEADVALAQERNAGEYRESLEIIQDESRRLSRLVDDLLNLARVDAGHVKLQIEEFYLNDIVAECCRSVEGLAAARQVRLACCSPGDVPFRGDEELLRRAVVNLLDNAIRYTPAGGEVNAMLAAEAGHCQIRVSDTGAGIAPEAVPHIFERFYRADKARSRQDGGFGLGLAIVKWIVESHGGAVEVATEPGVGSTFTLLLPRP